MKKLFILVLLVTHFFGYGQYTSIPDVNFELALINEGIDNGPTDGKVLTSKVSAVINLNVSQRVITDLTGLQDFIALIDLDCSGNNLTNLNISKNIALQKLDCHNTSLTNLDITKNTALTNLSCRLSKLTNLDITKNSALTYLDCSDNQLTNLDVSKNTAITYLDCGFNKIAILDIRENRALTNLLCGFNKLTSLDFSKNLSLVSVDCQWNQITSLDFSKNTKLGGLHCPDNLLEQLDLKNGNNAILSYLIVGKNPKLSCIQVDSKSFADATYQIGIPPNASFSEDCGYKTSAPIAPPTITATGNQIYCPGTSQKIVETISITNDPAEPDTDALYIQISSGYIFSEDVLTLSNATAHPKISTSWDAVAGKLKLSSPTGAKIPYTDFEAAIKDILYSNSSLNPSGTRNFSITIGQANFLPSTGHYYEFVPNVGITWTAAKTAAEALNYYGLKGYLATILSLEEAKITGEQASGAGWIGGSDAETEGVWKWVTGPESGNVFWNGLGDGSTPNFAYWNTNNSEPNNLGDEDFAHITAIGVGIPGSWNDLSNTGSTSGNYQPKGFIVEYGGMPGDPPLKISASTSLTVGKIEIVSTPSPICNSGTATFKASANGLPIKWYDSLIGGNLVGTGNDFTTPILTSDKSYFADAGCSLIARTEFKVIVNAIPQITATKTSVSRCGAGSVVLDAVATVGIINWYNALTGGSLVGTGTPFSTPNITAKTTYYAEAVNNGCVSALRVPIEVIVYPLPQVSNQEIIKCKSIDKELDAALSGMEYLWSNGAKTQKITVSSSGIYFVDITSPSPEKCTSRKQITVLENNIPEIDRVEVDDKSVTIYVKKEEIYFEYSIDGINYQASNVFLNVPIGLQTAYVREIESCHTDKQDFTIFTIKKYFTPNNDGINDLWEINDMKNFPNSNASIYDRYGKLIVTLNASKYSWDGNFNNNPLPADDYWFRLKLDDSKPEIKGHFSLKR